MYRIKTHSRLGRLCFVLFLSSTGLACMEIHIPPPQLADSPKKESQKKNPQANLATLRLSWIGKDLDERGWVKALSISRLFYSKINNQSGSLQELLAPALDELAKQKGFKSSLHTQAKSQVNFPSNYNESELRIELKRHLLLWLPPVEFIQTPRPRRRGKILLDFFIVTQFLAPHPRSSKKSVLVPPKVQWSKSFQRKEELAVFPGNEKEALEILAHRTLSDYLQEMTSLLRTPSSK